MTEPFLLVVGPRIAPFPLDVSPERAGPRLFVALMFPQHLSQRVQ